MLRTHVINLPWNGARENWGKIMFITVYWVIVLGTQLIILVVEAWMWI